MNEQEYVPVNYNLPKEEFCPMCENPCNSIVRPVCGDSFFTMYTCSEGHVFSKWNHPKGGLC